MLKARNFMILGMIALVGFVVAPALGSDRVERSFDFRGGVLEIDTERGSIDLQTGYGDGVRVVVKASRGMVSDYLEVRFEEGNGLRIVGTEVRGAPDRGGVEFHIEAPADMDVVIRTDGGHVEVGDITGEMEITTGGGHIEFGEVGGSLMIDTGGGHIEGDSVGSHGSIKTGGGHVDVNDVRGDLEVRSGGGHIEIGDVDGTLEIKTGGGHLQAGHVMGDAQLRSGGGHVEMEGCDGDVEVKTGGGRIELNEMAGSVFAHTGGGDIEVRLTAGNSSGVDLESEEDGDIILSIPSGSGFDIDAVASGRVEADSSLRFSGKQSVERMSGTIGSGGSVLKIRAEDGDIRIISGR